MQVRRAAPIVLSVSRSCCRVAIRARLASGEEALRLKKRSKVSEFRAEDVEAWQPADEARWTPEALGERPITDKKARKAAKEARLMAARSRAAEQGVDAYGGRTPTGVQD